MSSEIRIILIGVGAVLALVGLVVSVRVEMGLK